MDAQQKKPKLLECVRHALRVRHMARSTEESYVHWIRRFILFHNKRHPREMGKAEVGQFLTHLAVDKHVAASTQNQALAAVLFLYQAVLEMQIGWVDDVVRAKRPKRMPSVLTHDPAVTAELTEFAPYFFDQSRVGENLFFQNVLQSSRGQ